MSLLLIERKLVEQLRSAGDCPAKIEEVGKDIRIASLCLFLRAYKNKAYVLIKSDDQAALIEHARAMGMPPDSIVELINKQNHQN